MAAHDCTPSPSPTPPKASPYAILAPFSGLEADVHGLESMAFLAITAFERMIDSVPVPATPEEGSALWAAIHLHEMVKKFQDEYVAALTEAAKAATLARKDFGSKDGPGSIVTARPAQSSAGPGVTKGVWEMTDLVEMLEAFEAREKAAQNIQEHPEK